MRRTEMTELQLPMFYKKQERCVPPASLTEPSGVHAAHVAHANDPYRNILHVEE